MVHAEFSKGGMWGSVKLNGIQLKIGTVKKQRETAKIPATILVCPLLTFLGQMTLSSVGFY